jgi:rubrerythrin
MSKLVDLARRNLLTVAAMTGTAGIIESLGAALTPTLAAVVALPGQGGSRPRAGQKKNAPAGKVDPVTNDLEIINGAIQLEQKAANTYLGLEKEKIINNKQIIDTARQFAADHLAHRDALIKAVTSLQATPANIKGLGTLPIPATILRKEAEAVRYAMAVELIAAKTYYEAFQNRLKTDEGRRLAIDIMPVEMQHVGVFLAALKLIVDKSNVDNTLVPYASLEDALLPALPTGFSWDFEAETKVS